jgi:hypothetical protein
MHFSFEGSFLYLSTFGRTVASSTGAFAELCWFRVILRRVYSDRLLVSGKEYTLADYRWGISDPNIVSIEILTVLGAGSLCCYILYQLVRGDPARHYWIIVLCTAEIYGGWSVHLACFDSLVLKLGCVTG